MLTSRINSIKVRNYRSLGHVEVDLSDLTVLVGPNGSGKSNLLDVFRFLSDALTKGMDTALLEHDRGGIGRLRRYSSKGRPYDIEIDIRLTINGVEGFYAFVIGSLKRNEYEIKSESCGIGLQKYAIHRGKLTESTIAVAIAVQERALTLPLIGTLPDFAPLYELLTRTGFYSIFPNSLRSPQRPGNPYPLNTDGTNLASVLRELLRSHDQAALTLEDALRQVVPSIDVNQPIQVTQVGSYLVTRVKHAAETGIFDLALESDGTLRALAILTALYQTPPLPFIGIEEPEMMVHPGAMAALCDIFIEASKRSQIILTTHSPDLISRFPVESLRLVALGADGTTIAPIHAEDAAAVNDQLFTSGDLLRIGGLRHG